MLEMRNYIREITTVRIVEQRHDDRQSCLLHAGANGATSSRNDGQHDCGEIAIVENVENLKPIGALTDRAIAWRVVAAGKIPAQTSVRDAMSSDL
jgi:hypothetical protein